MPNSQLRSFLDDLSPAELAARLELALEGAGLGVWDWDLTNDGVNFDRRWCEMLGLDHATTPMQLETWKSRVHPDDLAKCYEDIGRYLKGETPFYENIHRLKHADGHWVYILDRGRISARDATGKAIRFTGTHLDVTVSEKARMVSQQDLKVMLRLINDMPASIAMVDQDMRYLAASEKWLRDFGVQDVPYLGKCHYEIFPDIPQRWKDLHQRALKGEELSSERDLFERDDKSRIWLRWAIKPWRRPDGGIGGIMMMTEDITQQMEVGIAMEHNAKMTALGEMASGIAHEINNPLAIISGKSQVLDLLLQDEVIDRAHVLKTSESIRSTVDRIAQIVQGMRKISRDASGTELTETSLLQVIQETVNLYQGRLNKAETKLTLPTTDFKVKTNPVYVSQILLNLLNNSVDALKLVSERWIEVRLERVNDTVVLSVSDAGPTIVESLREKIFQPFFTTKPPGKGTGLGLSVSLSLAASVGADLKLDTRSPTTRFDLVFKA